MDIKGSTGNCANLDNTNILYITQTNKNVPPISSIDDLGIVKKYNLDIPESMEIGDEEMTIDFIPNISVLSENVVAYIAGFVVKKLKKDILCSTCSSFLEQEYSSVDDTYFKLLNQKNRGGLLRPSLDVVKICISTEKRLRHILNLNNDKMPKEHNFFNVFVAETTAKIVEGKYRFLNMNDHIFDHSVMDNPEIKLIKNIISIYAKIRLFSFAKKQTEQIKGELIRKKLSKIILFSGQ